MINVRDYAQLARLPAMFTVCSNIIAAHLVAVSYWAGIDNSNAGFQFFPFLLTLFASLCLYHGGMVLNDCFDFDIDRRERPSRPLPSGRVSINSAWCMGWGLLVLGVALTALLNTVTLFIAAVLALAIVAYNSGPRQGWRAAINMGLCRYLNWLMAMSVVGISWPLALLAMPVLLYIVALTRISQDETDAKDPGLLIKAAVIVFVGAACWLIAFLSGLFQGVFSLVTVILALACVSWVFFRLYHNYTPAAIQAMMSVLILAVIPLDALLLASTGQVLAGCLLLLLVLPGKWLGRFLYIS